MPPDRASQRVVIAGASSLLGAEVKSLLEESPFASWDFSLVDEDTAAGTLTEAGGEPSVIQPVEEGTFSRARLIFFTGSSPFTQANLPAAQESGATVIDLSGASLRLPNMQVAFGLVPPKQGTKLYAVPSASSLVAARLLNALTKTQITRASFVFFRPVSEAGRAGIEELESQTSQLLSFQSVGQPVFDTQVAFNLLDRYGPASRETLQSVKDRVRLELSLAAGTVSVQPAFQILHAPVFYGCTLVAEAQLATSITRDAIVALCRGANLMVESDSSSPTGSLTASGDSVIHLAVPECDPAQPGTWWFWGAADNIRLPAATAVRLAEQLFA